MNEYPLSCIQKAVEDQKSGKEPQLLFVQIETQSDDAMAAQAGAHNPARYIVTRTVSYALKDLSVFPEQGVILASKKTTDGQSGTKRR
ncbi:MAG: hypothetical protein AB3N24_21865 [Leisingera sp.]